MTTEEMQPTLAAEAGNDVTALAVVPDEKLSTTIELEKRRILLQGWIDRQSLHAPSTKAHKELGERIAKLQQKYDCELSAWRGRQLLLPKMREASVAKRKATLASKMEATVERICDAVENVATVKERDALAAAVAAALAPPAASSKSRKRAKKDKAAEVDEDSE